ARKSRRLPRRLAAATKRRRRRRIWVSWYRAAAFPELSPEQPRNPLRVCKDVLAAKGGEVEAHEGEDAGGAHLRSDRRAGRIGALRVAGADGSPTWNAGAADQEG